MKRKFILLLVFILCSVGANAQWSAGISLGGDFNMPSINKGYATDVVYKGQCGFDIGAVGRYSFTDWFAVRADLRIDSRNYKMQRNYTPLKEVYTNHKDTYLHLPVVADFSFGGSRLRGHAYLGGFLGYWLSAYRDGVSIQNDTASYGFATVTFSEKMDFDSNRDIRFNAGLTGGAGISFLVTKKWEVLADVFYMYDLTSSSKSFSVSIPRYNDTLCFNVGAAYNF